MAAQSSAQHTPLLFMIDFYTNLCRDRNKKLPLFKRSLPTIHKNINKINPLWLATLTYIFQ